MENSLNPAGGSAVEIIGNRIRTKSSNYNQVKQEGREMCLIVYRSLFCVSSTEGATKKLVIILNQLATIRSISYKDVLILKTEGDG